MLEGKYPISILYGDKQSQSGNIVKAAQPVCEISKLWNKVNQIPKVMLFIPVVRHVKPPPLFPLPFLLLCLSDFAVFLPACSNFSIPTSSSRKHLPSPWWHSIDSCWLNSCVYWTVSPPTVMVIWALQHSVKFTVIFPNFKYKQIKHRKWKNKQTSGVNSMRKMWLRP